MNSTMNLRTPFGRGCRPARHCRGGWHDPGERRRIGLLRRPVHAVAQNSSACRRAPARPAPTWRRCCRGSRRRSGSRRAGSSPGPRCPAARSRGTGGGRNRRRRGNGRSCGRAEQPEALRAPRREGRGDDPRRVVERAPDALAGAGPQRQPVGIVDLGAPVDGGGLGLLRVPVHRGQRRDAEAAHVLAQEDGLSMSMTTARSAPLHDEAVGARDARAVEQGIDRDRVRAAWGVSK